MYLIKLRPGEIKKAVKNNTPVILASGSVEYHGPHLPIGTDYLISESIVEEVEKHIPDGCIVAPGIPFSPTMSWAASPEEGEVDFSPDAMYAYALEVLTQLTSMGFKRIYIVQHHQGSEGLPSLTLRRAAAAVIRNVTKEWGHSWGRGPHEKLPNPNIFSLIHVAGSDTFSDIPNLEFGHAGKGETQWIMASHPDTVCMDELTKYEGRMPDWLLDAGQASVDEGRNWLNACVNGWVKELTRS